MFAASKTSTPSGGTPDPQFNYVTMLLHGDGTNGAQNNTFVDSSSNNFTITRNGNTTQGSFSPYGSNWSNNFVRASTQYLTVSNSGSQFTFGTGAFTIECWVNLASMPSGTGYPTSYWLFGGGPVESDAGIDFYINDTQIGFNLTAFSSPTAIGNHGMSVGAWYHVAVVRGGGSNQTVSIYVNGTRVATASSVTATANAATTGIAISAAEPLGATNGNFNGYISNHRVVKGTAVYDPTQSTLTVPTTPLTAVTNTSLLTCQANRFFDASTNALTITVNGTPSVQRFSPFAPPAAYSPATIGGSGYFDGAGDYLTAPATGSAFDISTGNFTIESWVYMNSTVNGTVSALNKGSGVDGIYFVHVGGIYVTSNSSSWDIISLGTIPGITANAWNHVALVRNGNSWVVYLNGVSVHSVTSSASVSFTGTRLLGVGATGSGSALLAGYVSNLRIVKGTAVYTSNFTPPTAPVTAITNTSLLTNFTNGAIFDNAMMNDLETVGNAQISTSVVKFGTGSLAFDGTGDYLTGKSNPIYAIGTANFTVEAWVYPTAFSAYRAVFDTRTTLSNGGMDLGLASSSAGVWGLYKGSAVTVVQSSTNLTLNTWQHIAAVRSGSTVTLYLDGVSVGSATDAQDFTEQGCHVGRTFDNYTWSGYIDDLRVTRGYARYTTTFTPPTAAFPNTGPI